MEIEWTPKAVKDMRSLPTRERNRIVARIEQYADEPASHAHQVVMLTGSTYRRMRVGSYRVIFDLKNGTMAVMVVLRVRHRREAYG